MSLSLAEQWLEIMPGSFDEATGAADTFARDLIKTRADLESMRLRYESEKQHTGRLIHEIERLRARPAPWVPAVHVRCDGRCGAVVAFDPAPEEARMAAALRDLGWTLADGHWCGRCL
jgi:hypothetical protein